MDIALVVFLILVTLAAAFVAALTAAIVDARCKLEDK